MYHIKRKQMPSGYVKCNAKRNKNQQNGAESEGEAAAPLNHFWRAFNIQESNHTRSGSNHLQHATPAFVSPIRGDVMNRQEKGGANRSKIVTPPPLKQRPLKGLCKILQNPTPQNKQ